ncbi:MAG: CARDB domain-containing protein [Thermoproteota archaeon]
MNEFNITKKNLIFILTLSILGIAIVSQSGIFYLSAGGSSKPALHVKPVNMAVGNGQTFTVSVDVTDVSDLNKWDMKISWDPSVIELDPTNVNAVEEGSFLRSVGVTNFEVSSYQQGSGVLSTIRCNLLQARGASGSGTLFKVHFKAVSGGETSITISDSNLYNSFLIRILHARNSGTVTVGSVSRDLSVASFESPSSLQLGESGQLDITIENKGSIKETDVNLSLYANSSLIQNIPVSELQSEEQRLCSLPWTPSNPGEYNLTAYVTPISGETSTANNAITKWVTVNPPVSHDLAITFSPKPPQCVLLGESIWLNATVENVGTSEETDVNAEISVNSELPNRTDPFNLAPGESREISYQWTASTQGAYSVTASVDPIPGEEDIENNNQTTPVNVIQPSESGSILIVCDNDGDDPVGYQRGTSLPEFADALASAGYDFEVWNVTTGALSLATLSQYELVIWTCGDYNDYDSGVPDRTDAEMLEDYLEQGGNILIEGQRVVWNRVYTFDSFASNVLHVNYATSNEDEPLEVMDFNHLVTNGLPQIINWSKEPKEGADGVRPVNGGKELIAYNDRYKRSAVVAYNGAEEGKGSVIVYSFPLYWMPSEERNLLVKNSVNWLTRYGVETVAGNIINAPAQSVYFVYTHPDQVGSSATYDAAAGTNIYSLCKNSQYQGFTTTKNWFQSSGEINSTEINNSIVLSIGNPDSSQVTDYYESTDLPAVRSVKNYYGDYSFKGQDGETIASISASEVESGSRDLILIQTFQDGDNTVLIMYGFSWRGTWAAGVYFAEEVAKNLNNDPKQYYLLSWQDLSQDETPQLSEIDVLQTG